MVLYLTVLHDVPARPSQHVLCVKVVGDLQSRDRGSLRPWGHDLGRAAGQREGIEPQDSASVW